MNKRQYITQLDMLDGRRKKRNAKVVPLEGEEQEALFQWAKLAEGKYPCLRLMHHVPNGGGRTPWEGRAFKRRGVKSGVPDIFLPAARGEYHGLWIELKRKEGGRVEESQAGFIQGLRDGGFKVDVCLGWEAARAAIEDYLQS